MTLRVFGYGSLIWRPAIPHTSSLPGYVRGFVRRFWQGSTDHRGVPGAPGRVVTLLPEPSAVVWGRVFTIADADREPVLERLDHREKGGYARHEVQVHTSAGALDAVVYVATVSNPNFLGPASLEHIAAQVRASAGPSGPNDEYVLQLARALREMNATDDHVAELARLVGQGAPDE